MNYLSAILCLVFTSHTVYNVSAQEIEYVELKSPAKSFKNIVMPSHKGMPRLGWGNTTGLDDVARATKRVEYSQAQHFFSEFMYLRHIDSVFDLLDLKRLTKEPSLGDRNSTDYDARHLSFTAQKYLGEFGSALCTQEIAARYFCPSGDCLKGSRPSEEFGGYGSGITEFDRHDAYQRFISDSIHTELRKWWNSINREAYLVIPLTLKEYDIDKQGFPMQVSIALGGEFIYIPWQGSTTAFTERDKAIKYNMDALLAMSEADARAFRKRQAEKRDYKVYTVVHVKFYDKKHVAPTNHYEGTFPVYYLKSTKIEIYEDEALKRKVGEVEFICDSTT